MRQHKATDVEALSDHNQLLLSLAQQLRQPLLHIARRAELGRLHGTDDESLENILVSSEMALSLIDNYVLSLQSLTRGDDLLMEPVSVAAVMHDAAHELSPAAKQYGIELQLDAGSRCEAVSTHRPSLQAAFVSLGHALIEALASSGATAQTPLKLAVHRNRGGVVAGLYCGREEITAEAFRRSQILHGNVRQPHVGLSAAAGTGVFVADALFQSLATKLKVSRWHHEYGLAATLPPLNQLQLV